MTLVMAGILDLPDEILIHIFGYLSSNDMRSVVFVNLRFSGVITGAETIWKNFCKTQCCIEEKEKETWRKTYADYYEKYGHYLAAEAQLLKNWKKLSQIVESRMPSIGNSLRDGLSEEEIDDLERQFELKFPPSLRYLYRLCGGQAVPDNHRELVPGLFGSLCDMYSHHLNTYIFEDPKALENDMTKQSSVNIYDAFKTVPIATDYHRNQFCIVIPKSDSVLMDANNPPNYSIVWRSGGRLFHAGDTLLHWIAQYVEKIETGQHIIKDGHILRYSYHPECVTHTGPFTVKAGWVAAQQHKDYMRFEYRIIMEMDRCANSKDTCKLSTRHWDILHYDSGFRETVDGPGVVGEYPIMKPGASFSWMSRTVFSPPGGSMGGHFVMNGLETPTNYKIDCPVFHMPCPKKYESTRVKGPCD